jgi:hypothetical protein
LRFSLKERNAENVNIAKGESLRETRNALHAIQAKLDEQFKTRLDALNGMLRNKFMSRKMFCGEINRSLL